MVTLGTRDFWYQSPLPQFVFLTSCSFHPPFVCFTSFLATLASSHSPCGLHPPRPSPFAAGARGNLSLSGPSSLRPYCPLCLCLAGFFPLMTLPLDHPICLVVSPWWTVSWYLVSPPRVPSLGDLCSIENTIHLLQLLIDRLLLPKPGSLVCRTKLPWYNP